MLTQFSRQLMGPFATVPITGLSPTPARCNLPCPTIPIHRVHLLDHYIGLPV